MRFPRRSAASTRFSAALGSRPPAPGPRPSRPCLGSPCLSRRPVGCPGPSCFLCPPPTPTPVGGGGNGGPTRAVFYSSPAAAPLPACSCSASPPISMARHAAEGASTRRHPESSSWRRRSRSQHHTCAHSSKRTCSTIHARKTVLLADMQEQALKERCL
jgi:hypothetical protein